MCNLRSWLQLVWIELVFGLSSWVPRELPFVPLSLWCDLANKVACYIVILCYFYYRYLISGFRVNYFCQSGESSAWTFYTITGIIDIVKARTRGTSVIAGHNCPNVQSNVRSENSLCYLFAFMNNRTKIFQFVGRFACDLWLASSYSEKLPWWLSPCPSKENRCIFSGYTWILSIPV